MARLLSSRRRTSCRRPIEHGTLYLSELPFKFLIGNAKVTGPS
jgi:hypothetical protein